jgi:plastocyanin
MPSARPLTALAAAVLALTLGACGSTGEAGPATTVGCKDARDGRVTLVADDLRWDTDCLRAAPGPLTIEVDNQDDGVNHNLHLPDAPDSPATPLEAGPSTQELDTTLVAGRYEYICDLHPNMLGSLTVEAPVAPP